jgi:DNA polymerase-1
VLGVNLNKKIVIVDTFGFFFRSFYALPYLKSKDGFPTGLLTGFANFIYSLGKDFDCDHIVFALDSKGDSFRKEIASDYKANRSEAPVELKEQLPIAIDWIDKMGFATLSVPGFEADDIIASVVHLSKQNGNGVQVLSHDKDLYQLIDSEHNITIFDPIKKTVINEELCFEKYGVTPKQFTDYQSMLGDTSDNIKGVKGVGAKTAAKLLAQFGTVDNIYENLGFIEPKRFNQVFAEHKDVVKISKQLVTLRTDAIKDINIDYYKFPTYNPILKIEDELIKYGITNIVNKVKKEGSYVKTELPTKENIVNYEVKVLDTKDKLFEVINKITEETLIAFDTETTSIDSKIAKIIGFSFCFDKEHSYYVPIAHNYLGVGNQVSLEDSKEAMKILFNHKIIGHNLKYDFVVIKNNFGIIKENNFHDTIILAWLLNPSQSLSLDDLADNIFNHSMIKFKDIVPKKMDFSNVNIEDASSYASEDAWMTYKLYFYLISKLEKSLIDIANNIEYDFMINLIKVESRGIKVNTEYFENLLIEVNNTLNSITENIFRLSDCQFNLNSPKQLGEVLFEKLELPPVKKTKTGFSTNEEVLQKLKEEHEVIPLILEYRELFKLKSTYIEPLISYAKENSQSKIFTTFNQTGTNTGRLSSTNPNLQNIPTRTKIGKQIRKGFISSEDYNLVSIDYSQIELRLLAHFSQDSQLLKAFNENKDIHLSTAIKIFGEDQASNKRDIAKSINFGLIYGMGSTKLSKALNITTKEAKSYIDSYFESFPTVKSFLDSCKDKLTQNGYVKTIAGRYRYFDFMNVGPRDVAAFQREGVNTIFQGSASDIIKLAMNAIETKYKNRDDMKVLLQIHDELVFEIKEDICDEASKDIQNIMENIIKLNVPLKTTLSIGKNWGDLK